MLRALPLRLLFQQEERLDVVGIQVEVVFFENLALQMGQFVVELFNGVFSHWDFLLNG